MATRLKAGLTRLDRRLQGTEVLAESLVWICCWLVIPIHLARADVSATGFLAYAIGAGLLVSLGVLATNRESFDAWDQFAAHLSRCWLALCIAGGIVFLIAGRLSAAMHI